MSEFSEYSDDGGIIIEDYEYFLRYVRLFAHVNYHLTFIEKLAPSEKDHIIEKRMHDKMYLIQSSNGDSHLEELINLERVKSIANLYVENSYDGMSISTKNSHELICDVTQEILHILMSELIDRGRAEMVWDPDKNEIYYRFKDE